MSAPHLSRSESERDTRILQADVKYASTQVLWMRSVLDLLVQSKPAHGTLTITLPALIASPDPTQPLHSVWAVAKTNGTAALVPENLAAIYNRVDYEADGELRAQDDRIRVEHDLEADEARFHIALQPQATLHLTVEQRDQFALDLSHALVANIQNLEWAAVWAGCDNAVAHGIQDRDELAPYIQREKASLRAM
jgi:hypothetical protein